MRTFMLASGLTAFASFLPTSAQSVNTYSGYGFVDQLPLSGSRARTVALADVAGASSPDLAVLQDDGTLFLNVDASEYGTSASIGGIQGLAAAHNGQDSLWVTDGNRILQVGWDDQAGAITLTGSPTTYFSNGLTSFQVQQRPSGARLLAVDHGGTRALVFKQVAGVWTAERTLWATQAQGTFHDLAVVDWLGVGALDLALTTDSGLTVVDPTGATLYLDGAQPNDSWMGVLPAGRAPWGRDLLFWHRRPLPTGLAEFRILNGNHAETLSVSTLELEDVAFGDFLNAGDGLDEVILSRGDDRSAWVLQPNPGPTPAEPIFTLDPQTTPFIDLDGSGQAPGHAAPLDVLDVDGDLDEDLVFVDDRFEALWVLSSSNEEEALRPGLGSPGNPQINDRLYTFLLDVTLTVGDSYEWEVYYQPSPNAPVTLLNAGSGSSPSLLLTATLPGYNEKEVIQFLVRAVDGSSGQRYPARVEYWSPNVGLFSTMQNAVSEFYPWMPLSAGSGQGGLSGSTDPGGTTRRPKINPGP